MENPSFMIPEVILAMLPLCVRYGQTRFEGTRGIRVEVKDGAKRFIATDGIVLGMISEPSETDGELAAILPTKPVKRLFSKDEDAAVTANSLRAEIAGDRAILYAQDDATEFTATIQCSVPLVEGRFVDVDHVLPKGSPKATIRVDAKRLQELLECAAALGSEQFGWDCTLDIFDDRIRVCAKNEKGQEFTGLQVSARAPREPKPRLGIFQEIPAE